MFEETIQLAFLWVRVIESKYRAEHDEVYVKAYVDDTRFIILCHVYDHTTELRLDIDGTLLLGLDVVIEMAIDTLLDLRVSPTHNHNPFESFINGLDF